MATISFSVDEKIKQEVARIAKAEGKSKSDVFRDVWRYYRFSRALDNLQALTRKKVQQLGIETDDDFERYLG